jgi:TRAP-type transport system periplasmic protein
MFNNKCCIIVVSILIVLSCIGFVSAAEFELTAYNILAKDHMLTQALIMFADLVEERTGGNVKIDVFHSGELGGDVETIEEMRQGLIDMRTAGGTLHAHYYPEIQMTELPFLFKNTEHIRAVFEGPLGKQLMVGLEEHGVKFLAMFENGFRGLSNSVRPVKCIEDMKGLRIRVLEAQMYVDTFEKFGAKPIAMAWPDVYMSLQTGVIDGQDNGPLHLWHESLYEVQKFYTWLRHIWMGSPLIINLNTWNSIPEEYQEIMMEAALEASNWSFEKFKSDAEEALRKSAEGGVEILEDSELDRSGFVQAAEELYEETFSKYDWFDEEWVNAVKELGEQF